MSVYPYDPRFQKDPLGATTKSSSRRLLEDILSERIVSSLARSTASNYITESYGSNHRIFYEGVASLLSEILVDSVDNIDDSELSQLRAEFLSTRLLYSIFPPTNNSVPETDTIEELHKILILALESLFRGSTLESIKQALDSVYSEKVGLELEGYIVRLTSSILSITTIEDNHQHFVFTQSKGLGSTTYPIGLKWGDDLHSHLIVDGVVQPYTDAEGNTHTHEVSLGLIPNVVRLQENLRKVLSVIKPAHIKTGTISSVLEENGNLGVSEDEMILSLGGLYQDDMRRVRLGTWEDVLFGYASNKTLRVYRTNITKPNSLLVKPNENSSTGQRTRVLSISSSVPANGEYTSWSFPLDSASEALFRSTGVDTLSVDNGFITGKDSSDPSSEQIPAYFTDGSLVLLNGVAYYIELFLTEPPKYKVSAQVITTDTRLNATNSVVEITNLSSPWKVRQDIRYETYTFTYYPPAGSANLWFSLPPLNVRFFYKGIALNPTNSFSISINGVAVPSSVLKFYSHYDNNFYLLNAGDYSAVLNPLDRVTITYPYDEDEVYRFTSLNDPRLVLNATRKVGQVTTTNGRKSSYLAPSAPPYYIRRKNYVLNKVVPISPYTTEYRDATYGIGSTSTTNTITQKINSSFVLNRVSPSSKVASVSAPATKVITTKDGVISFVQLGFKPDYILSIFDGGGTEYIGALSKGYLRVAGITTPTTLTISALSTSPLTDSGTWYEGSKYLEGQAPLKKTEHSVSGLTESSADEIMANPLGLAEPQVGGGFKDAVRSVIARSSSTSIGTRGEPAFYEDRPTSFAVGGYLSEVHTETQYLDEVLYGDYSLYLLGPISTTELTTLTTIPTYLFFHYSFLSTFGGNGYYFSIYRISSDGIKYYQTLYPLADSGAFECFEEHPAPPNGAPLAYRWKDDGSGSGFSLNYPNGSFPTYEADPNGYFNHIPNQTYYVEVYMEQNGGIDELYFFSSGTNAPYTLGSSWTTSSETYALDDPMDMGFGKTYTFQVTFATNPGEVTSWLQIADPAPSATKSSEEVGATIEIIADVLSPSEPLYGERVSFIPNGGLFTPLGLPYSLDPVPAILDSVSIAETRNIQEFLPTTADTLSLSYLLSPCSITETTQAINDSFTYTYRVALADSLSVNDGSTQATQLILEDSLLLLDEIDHKLGLNFSDTSVVVDTIQASLDISLTLEDSVFVATNTVSTTYGFSPSISVESVPLPSDTLTTNLTLSRGVQDSLSEILDSVVLNLSGYDFSDVVQPADDQVAVLYAYAPTAVQDTLGGILDDVLFKYSVLEGDSVSPILDSVLTQVSEYLLLDSVTISDDVTLNYAYTSQALLDAVLALQDEVTHRVSSFNLTDSLTNILDEVGVLETRSISLLDSLSLTDSVSTSYVYGNINITESVASILDSVSTSYLFSALTLSDSVSAQVDAVQAYIKSLHISDQVGVTDEGSARISSFGVTDDLSITDVVGITVPVISVSDSTSLSDVGQAHISSIKTLDTLSWGDTIETSLSLTSLLVEDLVVLNDTVLTTYALNGLDLVDTVGFSDSDVEITPIVYVSDSVSAPTDETDTVQLFEPLEKSDSVVFSDGVLTSYVLLPSSVSESVPDVEDSTDLSLSLTSTLNEGAVSVLDTGLARISSKFLSDTLDMTDDVSTTYEESLRLVDGSIAFAGTDTSYLVGADISAFDTGTNAFRIEWWMYLDSTGAGNNPVVFSRNLRGTSDRFRVKLLNKTGLQLSLSTGSALVTNSFGSVANDEWVHIAIVGRSSVVRAYVNGVQLGSSWSTTYNITNASTAAFYIGNETTPIADTAFKGYITNLRYLYQISGASDLTTRTGTFSIPTAPLPSVSLNVFRLVATDSSTAFTGTGTTLTNTSSVSWSSSVPTITDPMSSLSLNGVISFPYANGYLSRLSDSDFNLGSGDFTIEWHQYLTTTELATSYSHRAYIFDLDYTAAIKQISVYYDSALEKIVLFYRVNGSTSYTIGYQVNNIRDRWSHFALSRHNGTLYLYQNGYSLSATKIDDAFSLADFSTGSSGSFYIGTDKALTSNYFFNGYLSNFRLSVGIARHTTADAPFTPPTSVFTTDVYTKLLLTADSLSDLGTDTSGSSNTMTLSNVEWESFSKSYADKSLSVAVQTGSSVYGASQFFVYSSNDYYARQARGNNSYPTLVSSLPRYKELPTNALAYEGNYKGAYEPALSAGYSNTTPTQPDLVFKALATSTRNNVVEEYNSPSQPTEYKIFSRLNNDASPTPEFNIAFRYKNNTWGSYYNLFPSTGATNIRRNYLHTLRVNSDGTTTFTQDTTGQTALYPYSTTVRLYAYFKNLDNGLGASATPQSTVLLRTDPSLGSLTGQVASVPSEYSFTGGLIPKTLITNTNNVSQMSWQVVTGTKYRLYLDKATGVDLILAFRAYTYTAGATDYNTLYDANNPPNYKSFSNAVCQQNLYLQVLEDGSVLITQS